MGQWQHAIEKERPASNLSARGWTDRVLLPVWKLYEGVRSYSGFCLKGSTPNIRHPNFTSRTVLIWKKRSPSLTDPYCQQKRFKF